MNKSTSWKFVNSQGTISEAYYDEMEDNFVVWDCDKVVDDVVQCFIEYECEDVEHYLSTGIWKRLS
jgi:hypothetical protein